MRALRAFTLIELLIVVAIIAILAAIAVPNFLEAQVRAKVTRQLSNLRTVTTALEAYRVDNTAYPACTHVARSGGYQIRTPPGVSFNVEPIQWKVYPGFQGYAAGITTPIAYLSSDDALVDIFRLAHNFNDKLMNQMMYLPTHWYIDVPGTHRAQLARYGEWVMRSSGPDRYYQNNDGETSDYAGWNRISYDSTNGTISNGDIYRSQARPDEVHVTAGAGS
jgi:prepilin-type N-terminal cleavage/methylation domain-containing protein